MALAELLTNFSQMTRTVFLGQHLDLNSEVNVLADQNESLQRALKVTLTKAASYSAEFPMRLGAILAGSETTIIEILGSVGKKLGQAFQLKDDLISVFGDPTLTGKPSGDDIREGKQTVLVTYALAHLPSHESAELKVYVGKSDSTRSELERSLELITKSGAVTYVEQLIDTLWYEVLEQLEDLDSDPGAKQELIATANNLVARVA
jgi:geranylgeranyl diphosphate synthase type I